MSWDVLILNLPPGTTVLEDVPDSTDVSLGPLSQVLDRLRASLGGDIDLTDPTWGTMEGEAFSIEFNIGDKDPCESIMLHVRGDDSAVEPIRVLCESTRWRAFDTTTGELMEFESGTQPGLRQWRAFRDRVAPGGPVKGVKLVIPSKTDEPPRRPWRRLWK